MTLWSRSLRLPMLRLSAAFPRVSSSCLAALRVAPKPLSCTIHTTPVRAKGIDDFLPPKSDKKVSPAGDFSHRDNSGRCIWRRSRNFERAIV